MIKNIKLYLCILLLFSNSALASNVGEDMLLAANYVACVHAVTKSVKNTREYEIRFSNSVSRIDAADFVGKKIYYECSEDLTKKYKNILKQFNNDESAANAFVRGIKAATNLYIVKETLK